MRSTASTRVAIQTSEAGLVPYAAALTIAAALLVAWAGLCAI
jgi:hypothetical protein